MQAYHPSEGQAPGNTGSVPSSVYIAALLLKAYSLVLLAFILVYRHASPVSSSYLDGRFWFVSLALSSIFALMSACEGEGLVDGVICLVSLLLTSAVIAAANSLYILVVFQLLLLTLALVADLKRIRLPRSRLASNIVRIAHMASYLSLQQMVFLCTGGSIPKWPHGPFFLGCLVLSALIIWKRNLLLKIQVRSLVLYIAYAVFMTLVLCTALLPLLSILLFKPMFFLSISLCILLSILGIGALLFPELDRQLTRHGMLPMHICLVYIILCKLSMLNAMGREGADDGIEDLLSNK
jgi:hypothetical protein